MARIDYGWVPERLTELRMKAGVSVDTLSKGCGVSAAALFAYSRGRSTPSLGALVKLADFFAVPVDYLLGRMDDDDLGKSYADYYMKLRRAPYEAYVLCGRNEIHSLSSSIEAPWPYNLLDAIKDPGGAMHWEEALTDDQMDGLREAMDSLTERENAFAYEYYEQGMTLEEVAATHGITRERVRQVLAKAVRKLRHPARRRLIELGVCGAQQEKELSQREEALRAKLRMVEDMESELRAKTVSLGVRTAMMPPERNMSGTENRPDDSIDVMDLSVRSWNCLRRAGIETIGDACKAAREGNLLQVRNLGRKSLNEIVKKLELYTGEDFSDVYREVIYREVIV